MATKHQAGTKQAPKADPKLEATPPTKSLEQIQEQSRVINLLNSTQAQNLKHFISLGVRQDGTLFVGSTSNDMGIVEDLISALSELANVKTAKAKKVPAIEAKMKKRIADEAKLAEQEAGAVDAK